MRIYNQEERQMKYKVFQRYSDVAALNIASYFSKVSI